MAKKIHSHPLMSVDQATEIIIEAIKSPDCDEEDIKDAIIVLSKIFQGTTKRKSFNSYF